MSNQKNEKSNRILVLFIINKLRSLGLKSSHFGFRLIIRAIQLKLVDNEYSALENTYKILAKETNKTIKQIEDCIYYAITHRNYNLSEDNFEDIFGYPYDEYIFSNKEFIEEFVNLIRIQTTSH